LSNIEIVRQLRLAMYCVKRDVSEIYKSHGLRGHKLQSRAALAEKLGVALPPTRFDLLRQKIGGMREEGMTFRGIGEVLGMTGDRVFRYVGKAKRAATPQTTTRAVRPH